MRKKILRQWRRYFIQICGCWICRRF